MASAVANLYRLSRAGVVLAQYGVDLVPKGMKVPLVLYVARWLTFPLRHIPKTAKGKIETQPGIAGALTALGPSYIKLGQFLATRADLIGPDMAGKLSSLQDKLPPFSMEQARLAVEQSLGGRLEDHFTAFGPPVAAASIAQVHKARVKLEDGSERDVAVKILRPGVERRFKRDLDSYYFAATIIERFHEPSRRLRPVAVVDTLKRSTDIEMDLRLEAAAISEMADNIANDVTAELPRLRVPEVDWRRTAKRVMTIEWIEGTPISDRDKLLADGHNLRDLGLAILRAFLRHAMRDGFFHADMHQGNLFVDQQGAIVAVDFGIMGRLGKKERRFLAEILFGLITRDYRRAAAIHIEAGYVPAIHSVDVFAQAMRAIGEPIHGLKADEISMGDLLGQLFAYTEVFDMETRPELIMLQKSMVIVEGVARSLDPQLNMWTAAEPIAKEWIEQNYGIGGQLRNAGDNAEVLGKVLAELPSVLSHAEAATLALAEMAKGGLRLDDETIRRIAVEEASQSRSGRVALWVAALALASIAAVLLSGTPH